MIDQKKLAWLILEVKTELSRASCIHPSFNSAHEGYAVVLEELDEVWKEIGKLKNFNDSSYALYKEAVQLCAMVLRFLYDCCHVHSES